MLVYQDLLSGEFFFSAHYFLRHMKSDELLSDSFPYKEIENGILWEVEGKWVVQGAVDVDIGANPSAEGGDEDEGVDDQAAKVVDIVDTFRLQEQPPFDKKQFLTQIKKFIKNLSEKLDEDQKEHFRKNIEGATKFLLSKIKDLQFFVGESMHDDGCLVFAYYKEGATDPTFLYFAPALKESSTGILTCVERLVLAMQHDGPYVRGTVCQIKSKTTQQISSKHHRDKEIGIAKEEGANLGMKKRKENITNTKTAKEPRLSLIFILI
ncbi:hypothetical protein D5086_019064 [Populus alba]|uniref:Uncharacterized protein n=1 Tax=Populus alba TaxID=43335 RepID=A0ACC4BG87_POPAL